MYNHVRTLLLNELSDPTFPLGEEAVPGDFRPRRLGVDAETAYSALFGPSRDRASKNWVLGLLAPLLHGRAVDAFTRRADPRVAYWPVTPGLDPPSWSGYGVATVSGSDGATLVGTPTADGPATVAYTVTAVPDGAVTVTASTGRSRTTTPTYTAGRSTPVEVTAGLSIVVPSAGGTWAVSTVSRPAVSLEAVHARLADPAVLRIILETDPDLEGALDATGHLPERVGLLACGVASLVDRSPAL